MIVPTCLAIAFALGVDTRRLAILAASVYLPLVVLVVLGVYLWRARRREDNGPVMFCESVAAELRGGASLRDAVVRSLGAVTGSPVPRTDAAAVPIAELAGSVAERFPSVGTELSLTIARASRSGSDVAALFDEIGALALAQSEVRREVSVAVAPGRATALLLAGAPGVYVVARAMSGNVEQMLRSSNQRYVALLGLGLFLLGVSITCLVIWRSSR